MKLVIVLISAFLFQIQAAVFMSSIYNTQCHLGQCPWSQEPNPELKTLKNTSFSYNDNLDLRRILKTWVA